MQIYSPIYAATEGLIGINTEVSADTYILHPEAMFFEFIPVDTSGDLARDRDHVSSAGGTSAGDSEGDPRSQTQSASASDSFSESQPTTLFIEQLEAGKEYELVVTNLTGLFRYRLGDVVRCVGYKGEAPIVEFAYRQGQYLNARGEKFSEESFHNALVAAVEHSWGKHGIATESSKGGSTVDRSGGGDTSDSSSPKLKLIDFANVEYFLTEDAEPRYTLYVECSGGFLPGPADQQKLDAELCKANDIYSS